MQTLRVAGAVLCLSVLAAVASLAGQEPTTKPATPAGVKTGQDAPDFELVDCAGKTEKLSAYKDKLVVLVWVNQKCPFSDGSVPALKDLHKKYAEKGVVWLGIDSTADRKPAENVEYIKQKELLLPILMDSDGKVGHLYGARTTPHVFVINKGKLVYMGALHADASAKAGTDRQYVDEALTAVLAGKDVPLAETTSWGCGVKYRDEKK